MESASVTPKSLKIALRAVGAINLVLAVLGILFLVGSIYQFFTMSKADQSVSGFRYAFIAMTNINLVFLAFLLLTAIRFIQIRLSAINFYSGAVFALFLYDVAIAEIWRMGGNVGLGVAAATGIGNRATAFFRFFFLVPYLYPLTSIILLQMFKRRFRSQQGIVSAGLNRTNSLKPDQTERS